MGVEMLLEDVTLGHLAQEVDVPSCDRCKLNNSLCGTIDICIIESLKKANLKVPYEKMCCENCSKNITKTCGLAPLALLNKTPFYCSEYSYSNA